VTDRLAALRPHEDIVKPAIDRLTRLEQWIAFGYLVNVLGARSVYEAEYEKNREYDKELKGRDYK